MKMKMVGRKKKLIFSLIALVISFAGLTQSTKMEKHYDQTFLAKEGGRLDVHNKYGEVIIRTWRSDSVRVRVSIEAQGKTSESVQKNIERINISYKSVGDLITVSTNVSKGTGLFKELLSEVDDYSKSIFGSNGLKVNYEVWLPDNFNLNIENKFGNIYMADLSGRVSIDLAHGDLKANRISGDLILDHSFGKNNIDFIRSGTINYRGVESVIREARSLKIQSSSSELELGVMTYVQLNSRNDKLYISEISELVADGTFSDLNADILMTSANLNFNYGDIYFTRVKKEFKSLDIKGKSANINLIIDQYSYILANITAEEEKIVVPNSMLTLSRKTEPETGRINLSGFVGSTQNFHSKLNINSEGGEVIIAIKELPLFSDKD